MNMTTDASQPSDIVYTQVLTPVHPGKGIENEKTSNGPSSDSEAMAVAEENVDYPTGLQFWLIIFTLGFLLILGGLDTNIVATAVPRITDHFHTIADVGWYSSAFRLCSCAFQFVFGKLYNVFPLRNAFVFAIIIFLVGSLLCATAVASPMFIAGRAVTGAGFAGIIGGFFTMLTHILPLHQRPLYCGILGGVESGAVIAAPIVGGALTQSIGWRWCFWINLPLGGAALLMVMLFFPHPKSPKSRTRFINKLIALDLPSNMLFISGLTCLFLAFSWAGTKYPWNDARIICLFAVLFILMVAFIYNQRRLGDAAALPLRIMKNRSVIAGAVFTMCTNSAINVIEYYLPTFYQIVHGSSPATSGYMMTPIVIGATIGMFVCGSGTTALGYYTPFMLLASVLMPTFAGLISTFSPGTTIVKLILYSGTFGFASGVAFNCPISAVQTVLSTDDVSLGIAIILFAQHLGPAVFVSVAQTIFSNQLSTNLGSLVPDLTPAFVTSTGLTEIVQFAPQERKTEVLTGIAKSLDQTWYLAVALTSATLLGSLLMEWRSVKKTKSDATPS